MIRRADDTRDRGHLVRVALGRSASRVRDVGAEDERRVGEERQRGGRDDLVDATELTGQSWHGHRRRTLTLILAATLAAYCGLQRAILSACMHCETTAF